jgi:ABC-type transport system substrate-binding protein
MLSRSCRRPRWVGAVLVFAAAAVLAGPQPPADPPKGEEKRPPAPKGFPPEVEDPLPPAKPNVIEFLDDEDGPAAGRAPRGAAYYPLKDLTRAAAQAKHPGIKASFNKFTLAFDRIVDTDGKTVRACPIPVHWPDKFPNPFGYFEIDAANKVLPLKKFDTSKLRKVYCFEELAIDEAKTLADPPKVQDPTKLSDAPAADRLAAAETLLASVWFTHEAAWADNKRKGKGWNEVKEKLRRALADARLARFRQAAADKDWTLVGTLGARLAALNEDNPKVLAEVAAARLAEAEFLVGPDRPPIDLERARLLVDEFQLRHPGTEVDRVRAVENAIGERAKKLLDDAEHLLTQNKTEAGKLLTTIAKLDPDNPRLRPLRTELAVSAGVLAVGTRRLPERMTPSTARYDSEIQAVDLLFEGLIEPVPDEVTGVRYRPVLAADRPEVVAAGRAFRLVDHGDWGGTARGGFDAADVLETVKLLRKQPGTWPAAPLEWLAEPKSDAPGSVRLPFNRGFMDPRALVSFKILPGRWLVGEGKLPDDLSFAAAPFGTGPFRLHAADKAEPKSEFKQVVFEANPRYGRRPGRPGEPALRDVRFVDLTGQDVPRLFAAELLHIYPDVPTREIGRYELTTNTGARVSVYTAAVNRRVHALAVNVRKPALRDEAVRRGLLHAIDREAILKEVYRLPGDDKYHAAMTGPFPPNSWATARPNGLPAEALYNPDKAQAQFADALKGKAAPSVGLLFPADDAQARQACTRMKEQIERLAVADGSKLTVNLEPAPPAEFFERVYAQHRFDLAYVAIDYPDDGYPFGLGSLLDPRADGRFGRNVTGFRTEGTTPGKADEDLGRLLVQIRDHRDPAAVTALAHDIHDKFNASAPFIPLWQLDRHVAISVRVKLVYDGLAKPLTAQYLDPTHLFLGAGKWRLD